MAVHWFPGHMHKALKEMQEALSTVDILIEVLDARLPYSSENPEIARLRGDKPCIKIFNKSDLANPELTAEWQAHLEQDRSIKTYTTSLEDKGNTKHIIELIRQTCATKDKSIKNITAMIIGIPNVGKSTIVNILADRVIAKTGNEAGVTKNQQRINLGSGIVLLDTPGVLWPKFLNPNSGYRLGISGAVKDTALEYDDIGFFAADYLIKAYPENLKTRFKLDDIPDTEIEFLEAAAKTRGAIMTGGRVNLHKICELLIGEFRTGKLGPVSLETPTMIEAELAEVARIAEKKAADKLKRKERFKDGSLTPDKHDRKEVRTKKRGEQSARDKARQQEINKQKKKKR